MGRKYVRINRHIRNGKRYTPYNSFTKNDLNTAMEKVSTKEMSIRNAAKLYNIPRSTLARHCKNHDTIQGRAGRPTIFSAEEEQIFVDHFLLLSEWGFPMDKTDIRVFAQRYLKKIGRNVPNLKDSLPGHDWVRNFLERHADRLSNRLAANISSERAKITVNDLDIFFENFAETVRGVKPENLINYDETNLTDDPGAKKYIFKRGCKYPERVINNSKTAVSIMFSGAANGEMLPMYVVYKSEHLWDQWTLGGPENTRYNRSKSGWFDNVCFEDWFFTVVLPYFKNKTGRKVIVGDNLSSHFSTNVLKSCQENNIKFVCLPPNSTHILQPLDVAVFAPMKRYWRSILTQWKTTVGRKQKTLTKSDFPKLLSKLNDKLTVNDTASTNIQSGFEKCGIYPLNPDRPKSRLPQGISTEDANEAASSVVINILQEIRGSQSTNQNKRKKRCDVQPGRSITEADINRTKKKTYTNRIQKTRNINNKQKVTIIQNPEIEIEVFGALSSDEENENKNPQSQNKINKHAKITKTSRRISSTTEESDINISVHSDSDIIDIPSDDSDITYFEDEDSCEKARTVTEIEREIWEEIAKLNEKESSEKDTVNIISVPKQKQVKEIAEIGKLREDTVIGWVIADEEVKKISENEDFEKDLYSFQTTKETEKLFTNDSIVGLTSHEKPEKTNTKIKDLKSTTEGDKIGEDTEKNNVEETDNSCNTTTKEWKLPKNIENNDKTEFVSIASENIWNVGDTVAVRYYIRKSWKHYIGRIINIDNLRHIYSILYYKTIKKDGLKFVNKDWKDQDQVPYSNIVKKVQLIKIKENPATYVLDIGEDTQHY